MNIGSGGSNSTDFDLNITPIIDAFTVLIAFMLASASFLSIGILDAGIAAGGAEATANTAPPPVTIQMNLLPDRSIRFEISGKENSKFSIPPADGTWNLGDAVSRLEALKAKWPTVSALTLTAENTVEYKDVVTVMESARKSHPNVLLGGF